MTNRATSVSVTLIVYRVDRVAIRAHEYWHPTGSDVDLYVADVQLPRRRFPRARPGGRLRLAVPACSAPSA